jgi:hypothetical protein
MISESPKRADAMKAKIAFMARQPAISKRLLEALLQGGRVMAIVDSVSEKPESALKVAIRPDAGAASTHALVVTGRLAASIPDALVVTPLGLTLGFLDGFLDELVGRSVGAGRFTGPQRETIRSRLISVMKDLEPTAEMPALIVALMVHRANELATNESSDLATLPQTFSGLVEAYVGRESTMIVCGSSPRQVCSSALEALAIRRTSSAWTLSQRSLQCGSGH